MHERGADRSGLQPSELWGGAFLGRCPGWYGTGPLALQDQTCASSRSLASFSRAKGATSYQPGASPQEWNHPTKQRAESPFHRVAGCETGNHFRGVTKMIPDEFPPKIPAAGFYQRSSSQGFLDYSNRRLSRVTEDSSVTARSGEQGLFIPRSEGNRQGILDSSNRTEAHENYRGILGCSDVGMKRGAALRRVGIGRAFSPRECAFRIPGAMPQAGMTLGLWPSISDKCHKSQTRLFFRASHRSSAPTAHLYTSLGQRPRTCPRKPHEG